MAGSASASGLQVVHMQARDDLQVVHLERDGRPGFGINEEMLCVRAREDGSGWCRRIVNNHQVTLLITDLGGCVGVGEFDVRDVVLYAQCQQQ